MKSINELIESGIDFYWKICGHTRKILDILTEHGIKWQNGVDANKWRPSSTREFEVYGVKKGKLYYGDEDEFNGSYEIIFEEDEEPRKLKCQWTEDCSEDLDLMKEMHNMDATKLMDNFRNSQQQKLDKMIKEYKPRLLSKEEMDEIMGRTEPESEIESLKEEIKRLKKKNKLLMISLLMKNNS